MVTVSYTTARRTVTGTGIPAVDASDRPSAALRPLARLGAKPPVERRPS